MILPMSRPVAPRETTTRRHTAAAITSASPYTVNWGFTPDGLGNTDASYGFG